jgi:hypothetical protein
MTADLFPLSLRWMKGVTQESDFASALFQSKFVFGFIAWLRGRTPKPIAQYF